MIHIIQKHGGRMPMTDLASALKVSMNQLRQLVRDEAGITTAYYNNALWVVQDDSDEAPADKLEDSTRFARVDACIIAYLQQQTEPVTMREVAYSCEYGFGLTVARLLAYKEAGMVKTISGHGRDTKYIIVQDVA